MIPALNDEMPFGLPGDASEVYPCKIHKPYCFWSWCLLTVPCLGPLGLEWNSSLKVENRTARNDSDSNFLCIGCVVPCRPSNGDHNHHHNYEVISFTFKWWKGLQQKVFVLSGTLCPTAWICVRPTDLKKINKNNENYKKTWVSRTRKRIITKPTTFSLSPPVLVRPYNPVSFVVLEIWDATPSPRVLASCSRNPRWSNPDSAKVSPRSNDQFSITWGSLPGPLTVELVKV